MLLPPPRSTRTDTLFPDTTLFRSAGAEGSAVHHHTIIGGSRTMVNTSTARRVIFKHRRIPTWSVAARKSADPGHGTTELTANPDLTFENSAERGVRRRRLGGACLSRSGPDTANGWYASQT